jgi:two-component system sensor histidine kinase PilS (NtrC family)
VNINVIDQGDGIPPEVAKHIFEPFYTTESSGSGLGLYIAKELTQMNGAKLDLTPNTNGGQFRISIPQGELL